MIGISGLLSRTLGSMAAKALGNGLSHIYQGGILYQAKNKLIKAVEIGKALGLSESANEKLVEKLALDLLDKPFWQSKKWWVSLIGILIPVINRVFELELDLKEIVILVAPLMVYVFSQGLADQTKRR